MIKNNRKFTSSEAGFKTADVLKYEATGKLISEVGGAIFDLVAIGEVLTGESDLASAAPLFGPLLAVNEYYLEEGFMDELFMRMDQGYESVNSLLFTSKTYAKEFEFIEMNEEEAINVFSKPEKAAQYLNGLKSIGPEKKFAVLFAKDGYIPLCIYKLEK